MDISVGITDGTVHPRRHVPATSLLAAALACIGCGEGDRDSLRASASCLTGEIENFVSVDAKPSVRALSRDLPRSLFDEALEVSALEPLDVTFGEEIDGVITAPRSTVIASYEDVESAAKFERHADERRGNVLLFVAGPPTPSQQEAFDSCLGPSS